jgi:3-deoxy-7-phosphoheptulonate synthase
MDTIVVMKAGAKDDDVQRVVTRVAELGLVPHPCKGEFRTIVGAIGTRTPEAQQQLEQLPGVDEVMAISQPYKLASREFHEADTILDIKRIPVGGPHVNIIAGPCAAESREVFFTVGPGASAPATSPSGTAQPGPPWAAEGTTACEP